jgi:hypothetical protein
MQSERREHLSLPASVLPQKFAKEIGGLPTVMPAKAGIQSFLSISWIPGRASYRQLARNDDRFM